MQWKILAGLRFFLAWLVVCDHLPMFIPMAQPWLTFQKLGGFPAVVGFLLISGYSIAHSITHKPEKFYRRRFLRIYPLYVLAVLLATVPFLFVGPVIITLTQEGKFIQPDFYAFLGNLFLLQGFIADPLSSDSVVWTLSIEMTCYLLAPLFIKLSNRKLLIIISISSILFVFYPYYLSFLTKDPLQLHYAHRKFDLGLILLLWAWLLGFFYYRTSDQERSRIFLIVLGCILLEQNQVVTSRWCILVYCLTALILIYSPKIKISNSSANVLNFLGDISYPLYLFHIPIMLICYAVLGIRGWFGLLLPAFLGAVFFYYIVDVPLRVRRSAKVVEAPLQMR